MRFKSKTRGGGGARKFSFKQSNALRHECPYQKQRHMDSMRHWLAAVLVCSVVAVAIASFF